MKPIVKWAGGKSRLLPTLLAHVSKFNRYYEPFFGGGALFFHLQPKTAFLNDANPHLMSMYEAVRKKPGTVITYLTNFEQTAEAYYHVRDLWNRGTGPLSFRAAMFIYLNKTCFNGLWRVNSRGAFNVPYRRRKANWLDPTAIRRASVALQFATLSSVGFLRAVFGAKRNDFVYFDPPYDGTFSDYTEHGFGRKEQGTLATTFAYLSSRGVKCMLSNADTPYIRQLYSRFNLHTTSIAYSIAADGKKRIGKSEVIVTNY